MTFFNEKEITCPCGCKTNKTPTYFIEMLEFARKEAKIPFVINSWNRCEYHNQKVGGLSNSTHLLGLAVDIAIHNDTERYIIVASLIKAGFPRVLIYPTFIHVDDDRLKVNPIIKVMK